MARMDVIPTLIIAAVLAALTVLAAWRGSRPPNLIKGPRMMPWRMIMLFSGAGTMLMVVHLVNLAGITTGRQ